MRNRIEESLGSLPRECTAAGVGNSARNHHREAQVAFGKHFIYGIQGSFGIECIENGFNKQQIDTAIDKAADLRGIGFAELIIGYSPEAGIVHVGRHAGGFAGRANSAGHETRFFGG